MQRDSADDFKISAQSVGGIAVIDIIVTDDVVLAEVRPCLHLDHVQFDLPRISEPVNRADGTYIDSFSDSRRTSSPIVTRAVPETTIQCSARWTWLCRLSSAPGLTTIRLTW